MKHWTNIVSEFLKSEFNAEGSKETRIVSYKNKPMLLIDSTRIADFLKSFNEWFKKTRYYIEIEENTIMQDYDMFFLDAINVKYGYSNKHIFCSECGNAINSNEDYFHVNGYNIICESCMKENSLETILYKIALKFAIDSNRMGSVTEEEMRELYRKLDYEPYCKEFGKRY